MLQSLALRKRSFSRRQNEVPLLSKVYKIPLKIPARFFAVSKRAFFPVKCPILQATKVNATFSSSKIMTSPSMLFHEKSELAKPKKFCLSLHDYYDFLEFGHFPKNPKNQQVNLELKASDQNSYL